MRKKKLGDRYDGRRVLKGDPTNIIMPYLLKERADSQVFFDTEINIEKIDEAIKEKRKNGIEIGVLDYIICALVRTISQYPRINRFVAGRRLYARDEIRISMAVKKDLNVNTPETTVKFKFEPKATIDDVNKQIRSIISDNKGEEASNGVDKIMGVLNKLPRFLFSLVINFLTWLDFHGRLPKFIHELSPFHTSIFITNMGSIGADPIYHHIYNWGTTSIFVAMGNRKRVRYIDSNGELKEKKILKLRFVADERIADGFYLSKTLKYLNSVFSHPEILDEPPQVVIEDDQV